MLLNKAMHKYTLLLSVADPGFDLRVGGGVVDFVNRGRGRKSLKVWKVEVKFIFSVFWPYNMYFD